MDNYNRWNQEFFTFRKRARIATLSLIGIGMLSMGISFFWEVLSNRQNPPEVILTQLEVEKQNELKEFLEAPKSKSRVKRERWRVKLPQSKFDPNSYTLESWMALGFSKKQAQSIINFKKSGFEFKVKKDVMKLFVVTQDTYSRLEPFIDLPDSIIYNNGDREKEGRKTFSTQLTLSINEVLAEDLMKIKGVGTYYSNRVLKFRDALGGFVNESQLYEVYGLPDSIANLISRNITVNTHDVKRHNINQINVEELKQHPYISYKLANSIVAYRKTHGAYSSLEELKELVLMDDETFTKVSPYLKVK